MSILVELLPEFGLQVLFLLFRHVVGTLTRRCKSIVYICHEVVLPGVFLAVLAESQVQSQTNPFHEGNFSVLAFVANCGRLVTIDE